MEKNSTPVKPLTSQKQFSLPVVFLTFAVAVLVGTGVGYGATRLTQSSTSVTDSGGDAKEKAGVFDKKTFPDSAEGVLEEGGIEGEGSFHLERPGGESQNVYLTSSTVDLSKYVGKKVKVQGQTFTAQKAGWLMDVGYIEVK